MRKMASESYLTQIRYNNTLMESSALTELYLSYTTTKLGRFIKKMTGQGEDEKADYVN